MIINIHTLTQYPLGALNRDFQGHLKTMPYGNAGRTRISSAALKRLWRDAKAPWAIANVLPNAHRSRALFKDLIALPLVEAGNDPLLVATATLPWIHAVCGLSENARKKDGGIDPVDPLSALLRNELVVLTEPEIAWIKGRVEAALAMADDEEGVREAAEADTKTHRGNIKAIAENASIETVLTGRFSSGDAAARTDSALSVGHAFTTHRHQALRDAMAAIDTLTTPSTGAAGGMSEIPMAAGTFYGYACLSVPVMVSNLTGCEQKDWQKHTGADARELVERLILTIYNSGHHIGKSNGASFGKPGFMMVEFGPWHQLNHAEAFETACSEATVKAAGQQLATYMNDRDSFEGLPQGQTGPERLYAAIDKDLVIPGATRVTIAELAKRVAEAIGGKPAEADVVPLDSKKRRRKAA